MPFVSQDRKFIPYRRDLKSKARELRANLTAAEQKLWFQFLRGFPHRVLRQKPLAGFIVDFYCAKLKLVIEIDGDSHFDPAALAYDRQRSLVLNQLGLKVLRFTNLEVMAEFEAVCERILAEMELEG